VGHEQDAVTNRVAQAPRKRDLTLDRRIATTIGPVQNYEDTF
jgi:hypothetical protein